MELKIFDTGSRKKIRLASAFPALFITADLGGVMKRKILKYEENLRMNRALLPAFFLMLIFNCCKIPDVYDDPALVTNLRFSPGAFDSFRQNSDLKYTLKYPSPVDSYIVKKDASGGEYLVKTLAVGLHETKGSHSITWLGDTDQRYFAPVGIYYGVININGRISETAVQVFHF